MARDKGSTKDQDKIMFDTLTNALNKLTMAHTEVLNAINWLAGKPEGNPNK